MSQFNFSNFVVNPSNDVIVQDIIERVDATKAASLAESRLSNSDKCVGGSHDATHGDFCYILRSNETSSGKGLIIETFYSNSDSGRMNRGAILNLEIPFRIMMSDIKFLKKIPISSQPVIGGNLEWNPGLSATRQQITTTLPIPDKYYEFNFGRRELEFFKGKNILLYNNYNPIRSEFAEISDIKANALEPKMMIEHDGDTDYITVCYNARVDLTATYYHFVDKFRVKDSSTTLYWTVPFVLRFPVIKNVLKTREVDRVNRYSWTYGVDTTKHDPSSSSINDLSGDISTESYNYSLIPHASIPHKISYSVGLGIPRTQLWPISWGCKSEILTDPDRSQVLIYGALGYYDARRNVFQTKPMLSRVDLTTYGFQSITQSEFSAPPNKLHYKRPVYKLTLARQGSTLLAGFSYQDVTRPSGQSISILRLYDLTGGFISDGHYTLMSDFSDIVAAPYIQGFVVAMRGGLHNAFGIYFPPSISKTTIVTNKNQLPSNSYVLFNFSVSPLTDNTTYKPFTGGTTFINKYRFREMLHDVSHNYGTLDVIPRPVADGSIAVDIPRDNFQVRSNHYTVPNPAVIHHSININQDLYSVYDANEESEEDYFYVKSKDSEFNYIITDEVIDYRTYPITITGSTIQPEYWANPLFAESEADGESLGVRIIISLLNCSGLYTSGDISGGDAWDPNARPAAVYPGGVIHGGIPLDPDRTRNDIDYRYYGTEKGYQDQQPPYGTNSKGEIRFGGSYTLRLENDCDVQLTYKGYNILAGTDTSDTLTLNPVCWKYNQSGLFNMYLDLYLNLNGIVGDDSVSQFTDDAFSMSNCKLSVHLKNRHGHTLSRFSERTFDITPPSASGYITSSVSKTNTNPAFTLHRVVNPASLYFTTVRNVKFNYYDFSEEKLKSYVNNPSDFFDDSNNGGQETQILPFDSKINLGKGDYVQVSYEPRLSDSRAAEGTVKFSPKITYVKGHKYYIDNLKIEFLGDSGWTDVTNQVRRGRSIYYEGINDLDVRVTFDANHETWPERSELADHEIYPFISGLYLFAFEGEQKPLPFIFEDYDRENPLRYEAILPLEGAPPTYPNHTDNFGPLAESKYEYIKSITPAATDVIYPGDPTLTSFSAGTYSNQITIDDPGIYQVFLFIKDEFGQNSCFSLTNIRDNYHIPFRSL